MRKISIRKSRNAIVGLKALIAYIEKHSLLKTSQMEIIEIGCYAGDSTEVFAQAFRFVYAVDPWQNGYDNADAASFQHDMREVEAEFDRMVGIKDNVKKIKEKSSDAIKYFYPLSMDVLYIDGLHTYESVRSDIGLYWPIIKKGGWLCGHDYQPRFAGVMRAVDEFKRPNKVFADSSWAVRKGF